MCWALLRHCTVCRQALFVLSSVFCCTMYFGAACLAVVDPIPMCLNVICNAVVYSTVLDCGPVHKPCAGRLLACAGLGEPLCGLLGAVCGSPS